MNQSAGPVGGSVFKLKNFVTYVDFENFSRSTTPFGSGREHRSAAAGGGGAGRGQCGAAIGRLEAAVVARGLRGARLGVARDRDREGGGGRVGRLGQGDTQWNLPQNKRTLQTTPAAF